MILKEVVGGNLMGLKGWSCTTPATVVTIPVDSPVLDFCDCDNDCGYSELAFVNADDETDEFRNDYKNIIIELLDTDSSHEFFLVDASGVEYPLIDSTYGETFEDGLRVGYKLSWFKVFALLGGGKYLIRVNQTDFSNTVTTDSHDFNLMKYSDIAANDTVKIETIQRGESLKGFDYSGLEWVNMVRLAAHFGNEKHISEIERTKDSNYVDYDIQTSIEYTYTLDTNLLPSFIADVILNSNILTDEIFITNYDVYAYRKYLKIPVVFNSKADSSEDFKKSNKKHFSIEFKDNSQNINRNFTV